MIDYTYSSYLHLMKILIENDYKPVRFCDVTEDEKNVAIIRHDVDLDLSKALVIAQIEHSLNINSTYFVMVTSRYYNIFTQDNIKCIKSILGLGHEIGLHFDISAYSESISIEDLKKAISKEVSVLECAIDDKVKSISWHIPKKELIGVHLDFMDELGLMNAYDPLFYSGFKYVSDSMMRWREPVEEYIRNREHDKLQILTHPIWYRDNQDKDAKDILIDNWSEKKVKDINYLDDILPGISENSFYCC